MENIKPSIIEGEATIREMPGTVASELIGSAAYLPAAQCADVDFLVLVQGDCNTALTELVLHHGYKACGEQYECSTGLWGAVRRNDLNLIVTHDKVFYDSYRLAIEVCKALRLTNKADRIAVCKVVRDRLPAAEARAAAYGEG